MKKQQLSFEEAKRLSIKKFQMHVDAGGDSNKIGFDSELSKLLCFCGFCERWEQNCENCEFGKIAGFCAHYDSIYKKWLFNSNLENATEILEIIINL